MSFPPSTPPHTNGRALQTLAMPENLKEETDKEMLRLEGEGMITTVNCWMESCTDREEIRREGGKKIMKNASKS